MFCLGTSVATAGNVNKVMELLNQAAELPNLFRAKAFICCIYDHEYLVPERDF